MTTQAFTLDAGSAAASVGEWVCKMPSGAVTRALAAALTTYGAVFGCCVSAANPGTSVRVCFSGVIPPGMSGLGALAGKARVNGTTARAERVASLSGSDYPIGDIDSTGHLDFEDEPESVPTRTDLDSIPTPKHGAFVYVVEANGHYRFDATSSSSVSVDIRAASDSSRGRWIFGGYASVEAEDATVLPTGSNRGASLNAAIVAASARFVTTGRQQVVRLQPGRYECEINPTLLSGLILEGAGAGRTVIAPHSSNAPAIGLADDRTNALVAGDGTIDTAKLNTTLSTSISPGSVAYYGAGARKLGLTSLGTLAASDYFTVEGWETGIGELPGGTNGRKAAIGCEILQVSATQTGPNRVTLQWPTRMHHVTANGGGAAGAEVLSVRGLTPLRDVTIRGITFDASGGTHAVGLRIDRALRVRIEDCSFKGFSRWAIELFGCNDVEIHGVRLDGECSGGIKVNSCVDCHVEDFATSGFGSRSHANGIKRWAYEITGMSKTCKLADFDVRHMHGGLNLQAFRDLTVVDGKIADIDARAKMAQDSEEIIGVAINQGAIDLDFAVYSGPLTIANITCDDIRWDLAAGVQGGQPLTSTIFWHDVYQINGSNIKVDNTGLSFATQLDNAPAFDYIMSGVAFQDCSGVIDGLTIKGCEYAINYKSAQGIKITNCEIVGPSGGGGANPGTAILIDVSAVGQKLEIDGLVMQGGIFFGTTWTPANGIDSLVLRNVSFDATYRFQGPLRIYKNASGGTRVLGDVLVEHATNSPRELNLPGSDGAARPRIVAVGLTNTVADGLYLLAAPPGTHCDLVKVAAATAKDDLLEASNGSVNARVNNSPTAGRSLGRAFTSTGGSGNVRTGPA